MFLDKCYTAVKIILKLLLQQHISALQHHKTVYIDGWERNSVLQRKYVNSGMLQHKIQSQRVETIFYQSIHSSFSCKHTDDGSSPALSPTVSFTFSMKSLARLLGNNGKNIFRSDTQHGLSPKLRKYLINSSTISPAQTQHIILTNI